MYTYIYNVTDLHMNLYQRSVRYFNTDKDMERLMGRIAEQIAEKVQVAKRESSLGML